MRNGIARMEARMFCAGYCTGPGKVADKSLSWRRVKFPAPFALIRHPDQGLVMFDTGYHPRFYECTNSLPEKILAISTPCFIDDKDTAVSTLAQHSVQPSAVKHLVLSHLHADHIAGVRDFGQAALYCAPAGYEFIKRGSRFSLARKGYLPQLLPDDFEQRCSFVGDYTVRLSEILSCQSPHTELWATDLFNDGLIYLVDLPGHAVGHVGLLCKLSERWLFLLADACWLKSNLHSGHHPHALASMIFDDAKVFSNTLAALTCFHENASVAINFVPSHCEKTIQAMVSKGWIS